MTLPQQSTSVSAERTVLHIGYHKTASTWLQRQIFPRLPVNNVPMVRGWREMLDLLDSPESFDAEIFRDWVLKESAQTDGNRHPVTVVSHEALSGHPHGLPEEYWHRHIHQYDWRRTARRLHEAFPDGRVFIVLRRQFDYMTSLYTYRVTVKGEESRSFQQFIASEGPRGLYEKLEYDRLADIYAGLFGAENILVLPLELISRDPEQYLRLMCEFFGVEPVEFPPRDRVNESTKLVKVLDFWRPFNWMFDRSFLPLNRRFISLDKTRYRYYRLKRRITPRLNRAWSESEKITPALLPNYEELKGRYAASNARIQPLCPLPLASFDYPFLEEPLAAADSDVARAEDYS